MKDRLLKLLKTSEDCISGEKVSRDFEVSRTYIWKLINELREEGYQIESVARKGYRLKSSPDILSLAELETYLKTATMGRQIDYFERIDSTNKYGKTHANSLEEGHVIVAEEQTEGRGRLGRSWISNDRKGLYFSLILKPDLPPVKASKLTLIGAAAVVRGLLDQGVESFIKWPNDIIVDGKKVCGILTELSCELDMVNYIVMGIGINIRQAKEDFGGELEAKAGSIESILDLKINRQKLLASILNYFEILYYDYVIRDDFSASLKVARERSILIGREVYLLTKDKKTLAKVLDISDQGELEVLVDGQKKTIYTGEVSIRGLDGYI